MILVTGGTGFLGSVLIKRLIDTGKSVIATKREHAIIPEALKSSSLVQWIEADVTDYFALKETFSHVEQVYHCAAKISYLPNDAKHMMHTNTEGTKHIVNLCLEYGVRLVHVSSIAALGPNKGGRPVNENNKWERNSKTSTYAISKYESEMEVWRGMMEGLDAVIVNPSVIMGQGLGQGRVAANAIFDVVRKGVKVYPTGSIGMVDVSDVADVMIKLMDSSVSGERFIVNSENLTSKDLLTKISHLMNKPVPTIKAGRILLSIGWRISKAASFFNGKSPVLTKESARAASKTLIYDNSKVIATVAHNFKPVQETLENVFKKYY